MIDESLHESCGIFGVFNSPQAAHLTYLGLYTLQHRGQESSGIAVTDKKNVSVYKGMGLVGQVFRNPGILEGLQGMSAIGHNRYSTTGSSTIENAQPILINCRAGQIAGAHNGNLTNADELRRWMVDDGSIFTSTTDTEVIMHLVARSKRDSIDSMVLDALSGVKGAYSILFLTKDAMYGARDPRGIRPLILGKNDEGAYFLSSETCAFDLVGAQMIREIAPGEMVRIDAEGVVSFRIPVFEPDVKSAPARFALAKPNAAPVIATAAAHSAAAIQNSPPAITNARANRRSSTMPASLHTRLPAMTLTSMPPTACGGAACTLVRMLSASD
jgi:amidophosphoribosyltransferase